jgi:two-component system sensor histidine kinase BaeS
VLAVAAAASTVSGRRITQPLRALTAAATRMRDGDTSVRVNVARRDEVGAVGEAFNQLAENRAHYEAARTRLIGDIAHELRTPLSNIRGHIEAAEDGLIATGPGLLSSLHEEALILERVVNDLQQLALTDAGTLTLQPELTDASELVRQAAQAIALTANSRGITLDADVGGPTSITVDPFRMRQAVLNLLTNAVQHTTTGTIRVSVVRVVDRVEISVADTGTGISSEDLPFVFDRLWRADESRTRATGGSGLGLAIAKSIVELHGGALTATSVLGEGSTFTMTLPADHG